MRELSPRCLPDVAACCSINESFVASLRRFDILNKIASRCPNRQGWFAGAKGPRGQRRSCSSQPRLWELYIKGNDSKSIEQSRLRALLFGRLLLVLHNFLDSALPPLSLLLLRLPHLPASASPSSPRIFSPWRVVLSFSSISVVAEPVLGPSFSQSLGTGGLVLLIESRPN